MNNQRLYLAIGIPSVMVLIGILINLISDSSLRGEMNAGFAGLRAEMTSLRKDSR